MPSENNFLARLGVRLNVSRRFSSGRSSSGRSSPRHSSQGSTPEHSPITPSTPSRSKAARTSITLQHGMEVDTVGDGMSDARLVDTTGDGRPDKIVYLGLGEGSSTAASPRFSSWRRWRQPSSVQKASRLDEESLDCTTQTDAEEQARARRRAILAAVADDARIPWESVVVGEPIGSGASGMVCRGEFASTPVALKILHQKQVTAPSPDPNPNLDQVTEAKGLYAVCARCCVAAAATAAGERHDAAAAGARVRAHAATAPPQRPSAGLKCHGSVAVPQPDLPQPAAACR